MTPVVSFFRMSAPPTDPKYSPYADYRAHRHRPDVVSARLSSATLATLPKDVQRPNYDLRSVRIGVVHFGPGAFHRAHQASYFDDALGSDARWAVSAVSLKSAGLRDALAPQDGLYTVAVLDESIRHRVIGCLRECLVAAEERERIFARLAMATTEVVTLTITEKGYCLAADGTLDFDHADVQADVASPQTPTSAVGYLVEGLRRRKMIGLPPFTTISCDNLADNGGKLGRAVVALSRSRDADLAKWIEDAAAFPRTMVDCIVPASDAELEQRVAAAIGVADAWPVQREAFSQWVVENRFCGATPDWASLGVQVTDDVASYERAKLRLLNGAHSTLAYVGSLKGCATVADAMRDDELAGFVERLMREDIAPNLRLPANFGLDTYVRDILKRFRNPSMRHQLAQIAWDGSQKLPFRILATIRDALAADRDVDRLCIPIAAWFHFVRRAQRARRALVDPLAETLLATAAECDGTAELDVPRFLGMTQVFAEDLPRNATFVAALMRAYSTVA